MTFGPPFAHNTLTTPFDTLSGQVVVTASHCFAILLTAYRIFHRARIGRYAWDDIWVTIALVLDVVLLVTSWLMVWLNQTQREKGSISLSDYYLGLKILWWFVASSFNASVWCCRISLAVSIARFLPPGKTRKTCIILAVSFFIQCCVFITLKAAMCRADFSQPIPLTCIAGPHVIGTVGIIMDIVASVVLVLLPAHVLWHMDLSGVKRKLVMSLFAATLLTLVPCLVNTVYAFKFDSFGMAYSSELEAAITLAVCNLLVVVTSFYRYFTRERDVGIYLPPSSSDSGNQENSQIPPTVTIDTRLSFTDLYSLNSAGVQLSSLASEHKNIGP
ncbi:hypothetical protein PM082_017039 [Marasmius tenuissimus]|nr:hypothetical protein PM082_017039 [Marasmius tenuissimus]